MSDQPERPKDGMTRKQLDFLLSQRPKGSCDHDGEPMYFHSRCHPTEPTWTSYDRTKGTVIVECSKCRKIVLTIKVDKE